MPWHVYMLRLRNGTIYVGATSDLERRWAEHASCRGSCATQKSQPVELIYAEPFDDCASAITRERQLKGWSRAKKLALANSNLDRLHQLAQCRSTHLPS